MVALNTANRENIKMLFKIWERKFQRKILPKAKLKNEGNSFGKHFQYVSELKGVKAER